MHPFRATGPTGTTNDSRWSASPRPTRCVSWGIRMKLHALIKRRATRSEAMEFCEAKLPDML